MKFSKRTLLFGIIAGALIWFLADAAHLRAAAAEALIHCGTSVIPALFPFMVLSSLALSLGFGEWLSPYLAGLMTPLFRLPGLAGSALLLGLVGGYPIGARTAAELYEKRLLTREEAERLLSFCNNSNPIFLISILGSGVFHSVRCGIWLWLIHVASALLVGICLRGRGKRRSRLSVSQPVSFCAISFPTAFVQAVRSAVSGILSVCGFVVFFSVLVSPFTSIGGNAGTFLTGFLELFSMTSLLTNDAASFVLAAALSGWGGLSVFCQTAAVLASTDLSLRPCLIGKLLQGGFSALLAACLIPYIFC